MIYPFKFNKHKARNWDGLVSFDMDPFGLITRDGAQMGLVIKDAKLFLTSKQNFDFFNSNLCMGKDFRTCTLKFSPKDIFSKGPTKFQHFIYKFRLTDDGLYLKVGSISTVISQSSYVSKEHLVFTNFELAILRKLIQNINNDRQKPAPKRRQ